MALSLGSDEVKYYIRISFQKDELSKGNALIYVILQYADTYATKILKIVRKKEFLQEVSRGIR